MRPYRPSSHHRPFLHAAGTASLCAAALLAAGCGPSVTETLGAAPPVMFQQAEEAYLTGDVEGARETFRRFIESSPGSPFRAWAYYWMGRIDLKSEQFTRAEWNFRRALDLRPEPLLRAQLLMSLGDVEYNCGRFDRALRWYRRVDQEGLSTSVRQDELFFKMGMCAFRSGDRRGADRYFGMLERFAGSPFLEEARRRSSSGGVLIPSVPHVLAAAFTHFAKADTLASRLRKAGLKAEVELVESASGKRYEVRIPLSPGAGEKEALPVMDLLEAKGFRPRFVP